MKYDDSYLLPTEDEDYLGITGDHGVRGVYPQCGEEAEEEEPLDFPEELWYTI